MSYIGVLGWANSCFLVLSREQNLPGNTVRDTGEVKTQSSIIGKKAGMVMNHVRWRCLAHRIKSMGWMGYFSIPFPTFAELAEPAGLSERERRSMEAEDTVRQDMEIFTIFCPSQPPSRATAFNPREREFLEEFRKPRATTELFSEPQEFQLRSIQGPRQTWEAELSSLPIRKKSSVTRLTKISIARPVSFRHAG